MQLFHVKSMRGACNYAFTLSSPFCRTHLYQIFDENWTIFSMINVIFLSPQVKMYPVTEKKKIQFSNVLIILCSQMNEWYKRLTDLNQLHTDIKQHPIIEEQQILLTLMRRDWWMSAASCPFHHSNSLSIFPIQRRLQETSFTCRCRCVRS